MLTVSGSAKAAVIRRAEAAGISLSKLGTTGGDKISLPGERAIVLESLRERNEAWLPIYMGAGMM